MSVVSFDLKVCKMATWKKHTLNQVCVYDCNVWTHIQLCLCAFSLILGPIILAVALSSVKVRVCLASLWSDFQSSTRFTGHGGGTTCYCTLHWSTCGGKKTQKLQASSLFFVSTCLTIFEKWQCQKILTVLWISVELEYPIEFDPIAPQNVFVLFQMRETKNRWLMFIIITSKIVC